MTATASTHTLTLSRLHKVIERVRTRIQMLQAQGVRSLNQASVATPSLAEIEAIKIGAKHGLTVLAEAESLSRELAGLRTIVAGENERLGINALLARQDALSRHLTVIKQIASNVEGVRLSVQDLVPGTQLSEHGRPVSPIARDEFGSFVARADALQREIYTLADSVADKNTTRVAVTLSPAVAVFVDGK